MHKAAAKLPLRPANEGAGRAGGKGGCLVLPTLMPSLAGRAERALLPLTIPVTCGREARQVARVLARVGVGLHCPWNFWASTGSGSWGHPPKPAVYSR